MLFSQQTKPDASARGQGGVREEMEEDRKEETGEEEGVEMIPYYTQYSTWYLASLSFSHLCDFFLQFLALCLQLYNTDLRVRRSRQTRATRIWV